MKLASMAARRPQARDGRLVVVSANLAWCADAGHIVETLQGALDNWTELEPALRALATDLEHGAIPQDRFHEREALAPLPRAYQWASASAYVNHLELARMARGHLELAGMARGAKLPESFWHDPLIYQGGSDDLRPARSPIPLADEAWGCDIEAKICVVTDDVPQGVSALAALGYVRLVGLVNDWSLRSLIPTELEKGFGFVQSKPATTLSPVLVTPDELGGQWHGGKLSGTLMVDLNGHPLGRADAGREITFDFGTIIAHLARTRRIGAGAIIGSGTVSNRDGDGSPGRSVAQGGVGYSCLAEQRMVEVISQGSAQTGFLRYGDVVRIEMRDGQGHSIFGAIEQEVVMLAKA